MTGIRKPSVAGAKLREWPQVQGCSRLHGETLPKKTTEKMKNTDLPLPPILDSIGLVQSMVPWSVFCLFVFSSVLGHYN